MGQGIIPKCKVCKRKQSYAITRYMAIEAADQVGYCLCVYEKTTRKKFQESNPKGALFQKED